MPDRIIRESALSSEHLAALSDFAERLFWRLTTVADDYGRFSANPAFIAGRCMPLVPNAAKRIPGALDELEQTDTIRRYHVDAKCFFYFPKWREYQQVRAKKSKYPDPPTSADKCLQIPADANNCSNGAAAPIPNTDSHSLPDSRNSEQEGESEGEPKPADDERLKPEDLQEAWNEFCVPAGLRACRELSPKRRKACLAALREHPEKQFWEVVFPKIARSPFFRGLRNDDKHKNWKADFDYFFEDGKDRPLRTFEGKYDG